MTTKFTESDLKKLTVPQLKLMCKDKRVVGYSKLAKDGIIAKFLEWQTKTGLHSGPVATQNGSSLTQEGPSFVSAHAMQAVENTDPGLIRGQVLNTVDIMQPQDAIAVRSNLTHNATISDNITNSDVLNKRGKGVLKRPRSQVLYSEYQSKREKLDSLQVGKPGNDMLQSAVSEISMGGEKSQGKEGVHVCDVIEPTVSQKQEPQAFIKPSAKRFKALVPKAHTNAGCDAHAAIATSISRSTPKINQGTRYLDTAHGTWQQRHLDFSSEEPILFAALTFPPTVSQRKHVSRLSLVLSAISFEDLKTCSLVSRAFRYSAYLSAFYKLSRRFQGKRLQDVLCRYSSNMINLWPYLRLRDTEVDVRKGIYEKSFLCLAFKNLFQIDEALWLSPNHEKQITIVLRFLMTKFYFALSVGHCEHNGIVGRVVDAQEVVENEIWKITYCSQSLVQTFYVLEATCEVIGESTASSSMPMPLEHQTKLRSDWAEYIKSISKSDVDGHIGLSRRLQWTNHEEYERGISKIWLKKIQGEGEVGSVKLKIATRYIFACVVGNSVSGPWRTANEMAQDFDGRSSMHNVTRRHQGQILSLFLPAHHHVESIHFTTRYGRALHPALALVQTPAREYFILKDNGMQVGCEEEGIGSVWMQLLGCTPTGCLTL